MALRDAEQQADASTRGMAQLSVIPGSATAWAGERHAGTRAAGLRDDALAFAPAPLPVQGMRSTLDGKGAVG